MSKIYDVSLGAAIGASASIPVLGNKVKLYAAPGGAVTIRTNSGESYTLLEGQGFTLKDGQYFTDLTISNAVAVAQTCLVFAGDARIDDSRISGVVQITNPVTSSIWWEQGLTLPVGFTVAATILAAASNPRGVRLRYATVNAKAGAGGQADARLVASPAVPVAGLPPPAFCIAQIATTNSASIDAFNTGHINVTLPASWGLFAVTQHTGVAAASSGAILVYEPF